MTIGTGSSMSTTLARSCAPYTTSVILATDVVPRLSHHTVEALLDEFGRKSPAITFANSVRKGVTDTFGAVTGRAAAAAVAAPPPAPQPEEVQLAETRPVEGFGALHGGVAERSRERSSRPPSAAVLAQAAMAEEGWRQSESTRSSSNPVDKILPGAEGASEEPFVTGVRDRTLAPAMLAADTETGASERDEAAAFADGMATGAAGAPTVAAPDAPAAAWSRLLSLDGVRRLFAPAAPLADGTGGDDDMDDNETPLAALAVDDPLRYCASVGMDAAPAVAAARSGVTSTSGTAPPPLYPPGRVLWLVPVDESGAPVSSTRLPSAVLRYASSVVFPPRRRTNPAERSASEASTHSSSVELASLDAQGASKQPSAAAESHAVAVDEALDGDSDEPPFEGAVVDGASPETFFDVEQSTWCAQAVTVVATGASAADRTARSAGLASHRLMRPSDADVLNVADGASEAAAQRARESSVDIPLVGDAAGKERPAEQGTAESVGEDATDGGVDVAVLDVTGEKEVFNYLTLSADMLQDHLPDSYARAVARLSRPL